MRATNENGKLLPLQKFDGEDVVAECSITIPSGENGKKIIFNVLPEISDSKGANYSDETAIGRSTPYKTYGYSENRSISMTITFVAASQGEIEENYNNLRLIQSAVYPSSTEGANGWAPPPICQLTCGKMLADRPLCVILKNYSVKFPTDTVWDEDTFIPYKFTVDTTWDVVYASSNLPGRERVMKWGY